MLYKWRWNWSEANVRKVVVTFIDVGNAIALWSGGVSKLDKQKSKITSWGNRRIWSGKKEFGKFVGKEVRDMRG